VYAAAVHAAATAGGGADLAGLVLADLASLHLRLGYVGDCLLLVELAEPSSDPSRQVQRALAVLRAWAAAYEQRQRCFGNEQDGSGGR